MNVRAKFRVTKVSAVDWNPEVRIVELSAVCADGVPENERYHRYTPSGSVSLTIDNPPAAVEFDLGKEFYLDFSPAPKPEAKS
jgi:hypothetical protein